MRELTWCLEMDKSSNKKKKWHWKWGRCPRESNVDFCIDNLLQRHLLNRLSQKQRQNRKVWPKCTNGWEYVTHEM
jgi:hypothetical protein